MMTQPALPDNWKELLAGYVLETLDTDEVSLVQQWLSSYPEVTTELERLQDTWDTIPYSLPRQAPPARLRQKVLASKSRPVITAPTRRSPRRAWLLSGLSTGWALTAIALVVLVVENDQLREEKQRANVVVASFSQPSNYVYTLSGTPDSPQSSGRLVIDPEQQSALIVTQNLPTLPSEHVYRLWALADADPVYCGEFNPDSADTISQWQLPGATCQLDTVQMLITSELASAPLSPQGQLVLQGQS